MRLLRPSRRLFLARAALAAPALITCPRLLEAGWQSRDSNYNKNIVAAGGSTTTFNPADKGANVSLDATNLIVTNSVGTVGNVRSIASYSTGKYYCEILIGTNSVAYAHGLGIGNSSASLTAGIGSPDTNSSGYYNGDNNVYVANNGGTSIGGSFTVGDVVSMAVDMGNSTIWFRINGGNWNGNVTFDPATNTGGVSLSTVSKPWFAITTVVKNASTGVSTFNFGASAYSFAAPSGFGNW